MITLSPIAENIQDTLYKKIAMMKAGAGVSVVKLTQGDDVGKWVRTDDIRAAKESSHNRTAEHESIFARSPFMRMTSFVPKQSTVNQPVILLGGELTYFGDLKQNFSARYKATLTSVPEDSPWYEEAVGRLQMGAYNTEDVDPLINTTVESQPYRPYPGIKDVSIEYRGGGMKLGATRTADINWTCWTWEELDRLTPHFLSPGKSILLEWGWTHAKGRNPELMKIFTRNKDTSVLEYDKVEINDLIEKVPEHVQKQNGDYDAILGVIQDFTWSVNATGGFDCTTTVISRGITLLQNRSKGSNQTFKKFETLPLLNLAKDGDEDLGNWTERVRSKKMMDVAPYITFREYMSDFPSQIFHKFAMFDSKSPARGGSADDDYWSKQYKYFPAIRIDAVKIFRPLISEHSNNRLNARQRKKAKKELDKNAAACWSMHHLNKVGAYHFITWGWFEDNVLSRFFGQVHPVDVLTEDMVSEFRSIQRLVDDKGKFVKFPDGHMKDGNPIYQSNRFRNSPYLVTLDTSKWIIPNQGDPIWTMNINWEKGTKYQDDPTSADKNNIQMRGAKRTTEMGPDEHKEFVQHFAPYNLDPDLKLEDVSAKGGPKKDWDPAMDIVRDYGDGTDIEHMDIRKILFNVKYLSDMMKDSTTLSQAVLDLWENFSNEYGGIYKFKIDLDESSQRMGLIEEGWTGVKVERYMENEKNKKNGDAAAYPNLFVFPTMEDGSIVKSQTINAQLPTRMKQAAMYAIKAPKSDGIEEVSNMSYDEFVGNIWGTHHNALGIDSESDADKQRNKRLADLLTGNSEWVGKNNYPFGLMTADESSKINFGLKARDHRMNSWMMIEHSILEDLDESEKKYLQQQYKTYSTIGGTGNETSKEKPIDMKEMDAWRIGFNIAFASNFNATFYTGDKPAEQGAIGQFYGLKDLIIDPDVKIHGDLFPGQDAEMKAMMKEFDKPDAPHVPTTVKNKVAEKYYFSQQKWYPKIFKWGGNYFNLSRDASGGIAIEGMDGKLTEAKATIWASHGYIMFRPEVKNELIKLLRGNENGVLQNTNVLIPIDFEMEIDGTGGLFPGNSFHSSYLSTRYKEETIFQMVGVNHIIDSNGWFTTIKGQIRSNALHKLDSQPEKATVVEGDNETVVETPESCEEQGKILDPNGSGTCVENPVEIGSNVGKSVAGAPVSTNGNGESKKPEIDAAFCEAQGQIFNTATSQCIDSPTASEDQQNAKDAAFMSYVDEYVRHRLARNLVFSAADKTYFVEQTSMYKTAKGGSDLGKLFGYYTERFDIYHGTGKYKENETAGELTDPATVLWAMPAINTGEKIYPDWEQGAHSW